MPTALGWGGSFLFTQASAHACHSLSRHMGSPAGSTMHIQPLVPARNCFIFPSGVTPITVAFLPISGGAAVTALAIVAASEAPPIDSWPFGPSFFAFGVSWAETAQPAR